MLLIYKLRLQKLIFMGIIQFINIRAGFKHPISSLSFLRYMTRVQLVTAILL